VKSTLLRSKWVYLPTALVAATGVMTLAYPGGLSAAYHDLRDSSDLREQVAEAERASAMMDGRKAYVADRICVKETLVANLIEGRATLDAVAAQFRQMNDDEVSLRVQRMRYGHLPDDELAARNVIDYVQTRQSGKPTATAVLDRVHREYVARFGRRASPQ
jgi:hypothetical protein